MFNAVTERGTKLTSQFFHCYNQELAAPKNRFSQSLNLAIYGLTIGQEMNYVFLLIAMMLQMQATEQSWSPSSNPDPSKIFEEMRDDVDAGRYEIALQKHVWFHKNALKFEPSLYGVRLSYALSNWTKLGAKYKPAITKLEEIRSESAKTITAKQPEGGGKQSQEALYSLFHDVTAIDESQGQTNKTTELFVQLDNEQKSLATKVYSIAQPALLKSKKYELCGKYINPKKDWKQILLGYKRNLKLAEDPKFGDDLKRFGQLSLTEKSASLVAILAINKRQEEANEVAKKAKATWDNKEFHQVLDDALKGKFPIEKQ